MKSLTLILNYQIIKWIERFITELRQFWLNKGKQIIGWLTN